MLCPWSLSVNENIIIINKNLNCTLNWIETWNFTQTNETKQNKTKQSSFLSYNMLSVMMTCEKKDSEKEK